MTYIQIKNYLINHTVTITGDRNAEGHGYFVGPDIKKNT